MRQRMKPRACCLTVLGFVRPPISKALAVDALQGQIGAASIVNAQLGAVGIAEIELVQVTLQVLFATVLVGANHAALEDRKGAFNRIGMDIATDVFPGAMVH